MVKTSGKLILGQILAVNPENKFAFIVQCNLSAGFLNLSDSFCNLSDSFEGLSVCSSGYITVTTKQVCFKYIHLYI